MFRKDYQTLKVIEIRSWILWRNSNVVKENMCSGSMLEFI